MKLKELREEVKLSDIRFISLKFNSDEDGAIEIDLKPKDMKPEQRIMSAVFNYEDLLLERLGEFEVVELDLDEGDIILERTELSIMAMYFYGTLYSQNYGFKLNIEE